MIFYDMFAGPAIDFRLREAGRVIGVHPAQQMKAGGRITLLQHPGSLDIFHNPLVAHQPRNHEEVEWSFAHGLVPEMLDIDATSEEHTSELQSLMRISYAVFCLKQTTNNIIKVLIQQTK